MPLIRHDGPLCPGGYAFTDPKTGMRFPGMEGNFDSVVRAIIRHRLANPKVYPTSEPEQLSYDFVAKILDDYTCQRLGNDRRYCTDGNVVTNRAVAAPSNLFYGACKCGGKFVEDYCKTCSGKKLIGYVCEKCGATRHR